MNNCLFCNTPFSPSRRGHSYCSTQCKNAAALARERWRIVDILFGKLSGTEDEIYSLLWTGPIPPRASSRRMCFENLLELRGDPEGLEISNPYLSEDEE